MWTSYRISDILVILVLLYSHTLFFIVRVYGRQMLENLVGRNRSRWYFLWKYHITFIVYILLGVQDSRLLFLHEITLLMIQWVTFCRQLIQVKTLYPGALLLVEPECFVLQILFDSDRLNFWLIIKEHAFDVAYRVLFLIAIKDRSFLLERLSLKIFLTLMSLYSTLL